MGQVIRNDVGVLEEVTADQENAIANMQQGVNSTLQGGGIQRAMGVDDRAVEAVQRFQGNAFPQGSIQAMMGGSGVQRDQLYSGNNQGTVGYWLEPGLKFVIPQRTPLSNLAPRLPLVDEQGRGIDEINQRVVLDFFGGNGPSVMSGVLGQQMSVGPSRANYNLRNLKFKARQIAWSDLVTDEDLIYSDTFEGDVLAMASAKLLPAWKQIEEQWLINGAEALWTPPLPIVTGSATGGSLAAATYWVIVTAANANGESLGTTVQSVVVGGSGSGSIALTLFSVTTGPGTITAYNVYVGSGGSQPANSAMWRQGAANFLSGAVPANIVGVNQGYQNVTLITAATSGTAYSSVVTAYNAGTLPYLAIDSTNSKTLTFDGVMAQLFNNGGSINASNTYSTYGVGGMSPYIIAPAATNGVIVQNDIDTLLRLMYLNAGADPEYLFCSVVDHSKLTAIVATGSNTRIVLNADAGESQGNLTVGYRASRYFNQNTGRLIQIVMLPYLVQGTLIFGSFNLPYPVQGINQPPFRVGYNRDLYSRVYMPDQSHQTQTTVTAFGNETLINQFMGGWGIIRGITIG